MIVIATVIVIAFIGCAGKPVPTRGPHASAVQPIVVHPPALARAEGSIRGRVLLDGKPVPYYGVIVSDNFAMSLWDVPTPIRSGDGRFVILGLKPGTRDITIVGPGFGKFTAAGQEVRPGDTLDFGDIALKHGHSIVGHVSDADGTAVAGAKVTIASELARPDDDELTAIALGNFAITTDARGAYHFKGVSVFDLAGHHPKIVATAGTHATSVEVYVPTGDTTIDLVLLPAGGIDGVVDRSARRGRILASPLYRRDNSWPASQYASIGSDGRFRFDNLIPGEYELQLLPGGWGMASPPTVRVTVEANKRATVAIAASPAQVTITVHVSGAACQQLELRPASRRTMIELTLAQQTCVDAADVEITGVAPGSYRVCSERDCMPIEVGPSPTRQSFELVTKF